MVYPSGLLISMNIRSDNEDERMLILNIQILNSLRPLHFFFSQVLSSKLSLVLHRRPQGSARGWKDVNPEHEVIATIGLSDFLYCLTSAFCIYIRLPIIMGPL